MNKVITALLAVSVIIISTSTLATERNLTKKEKAKLTNLVKDKLNDPDSVKIKFGKMVVNKNNIYCGMVNAKNVFGGYVGFMPFIASISEPIGGYDLSTVISIADDKYGYEAIVTQCTQYGYSL